MGSGGGKAGAKVKLAGWAGLGGPVWSGRGEGQGNSERAWTDTGSVEAGLTLGARPRAAAVQNCSRDKSCWLEAAGLWAHTMTAN